MPKVSVYLPESLYRAAREQHLSVSALAQRAIEDELRAVSTNRWIDQVNRRPRRATSSFDTAELLDEVRSEFGA